MKIGSLELENPYFLAPMEAVNCASFRVLCKKRGAGLIYSDMIDADDFAFYVKNNSIEEAIDHYLNPQDAERPLFVQLGGGNVQNLLFSAELLQKYVDGIDLNCGCPLKYMLGKKGGAYLIKHPEQLFKIVSKMREIITIPFTVKIRAGWDDQSINAVEVAKGLEKIGVDAITIHPRTLTQRYRDKANWHLVKDVKHAVKIPVILSGDVLSAHLAASAFKKTNCDAIMFARGAKVNPSIFSQLQEKDIAAPKRTYGKESVDPIQDFKDFVTLYKEIEFRYKFSEIKDHALWTATECDNNKEITQEIMQAESEEQLVKIIEKIKF